MKKHQCQYCKKEFTRDTKRPYKFCSKVCSNRFHCLGKQSFRFIGRIKRTGYWYIYQPQHPQSGKQGYVAEHRLIMEKHLGRLLSKSEVVHHINHSITDNRIENLQLFSSRGQHTKLAHPELFSWQKVVFSGKHFSPTTEFKKGQKAWNKGKSWSKKTREKIRIARWGK